MSTADAPALIRRPRRELPGWPPVLDDELAALYLAGMSVATFRAQVAPHLRKIHLTRRLVGWLRSDLDAWLAQRAGGAASSPPSNPWHKP